MGSINTGMPLMVRISPIPYSGEFENAYDGFWLADSKAGPIPDSA